MPDADTPLRATDRARCAAALAVAVAAATGGCDRTPVPGQPIEVVATLGSLGDTPGKFAYPRAMDSAADGRTLWVIDKTARVQRIDPETGRCLAMWRMPDSENGKPVGFCIAPGRDGEGEWCDELVYVADTHYSRIMVYKPPAGGGSGPEGLPDAELVARFGQYGQGDGQFLLPTDIAVLVGDDGASVRRIYVAEYGGNDRVSVFDGDYRFLFSFGMWGDGREGEGARFARPQSLVIATVSDRKELIVADSCNHRLGRFSLEGELIGWIGSREEAGAEPGRFRYPYGLGDLKDGTVMVAEFGGNRVQRIDLATGEGLGTWGRNGQGEGELAAPWAIAVLGRQTFVADSGHNRVIGFATPRRRG